MRNLIFGTLAILFLFSQATLAQEWEQLTTGQVYNEESTLARDFYELAMRYIIQKGKFESPEAPLPGNDYNGGNGDTTYERRNTSTVTYYRYNFLLEEKGGPSAVNATVVISYNPSDSNFTVTDYSYNVDENGSNEEGETEAEAEDDPDFEFAYIDARTLTGDGELASVLSDSFNSAIADHIDNGNLPDAEYSIDFVYGAWMQQFNGDAETNFNEEGEISGEGEFSEEQTEEDEEQPLISLEEGEGDDEIVEEEEEEADISLEEGEGDGRIAQEEEEGVSSDEESSGPQPGYKIYEIILKAKNSEGKYYLIIMDIYYTKENGEFILEKNRVWAGIQLRE